jgi:predicted peroxiredoxin
MKKLMILLAFALLFVACVTVNKDKSDSAVPLSEETVSVNDGVFIHISNGYNDPHRVLMALNMAVLMSDDKDVVLYFDIKGIEIVLNDSEDLEFSHFPSSHTQIKTLLEKGVKIMACPGCLKAAGKTGDDLMEGIQVADKETFFNFTQGRILTIDY